MIDKALYLVLAVNLDGQKERLRMWIAQTEGAKCWLSVLTELQNRGVKDLFIACVDGLGGLPEAIETVYPQARVQWCMVHLMRNLAKKWSMPIRDWKPALNRFAIEFEGRFPR